MNVEPQFKQDKDSNTCGINVCRAIIYYIQNTKISQDSILKKVKELSFENNNWKQNFLNGTGPMPTTQLRELLLKEFGIELELKENVSTADIQQKEVLAILEPETEGWHAVLIREIKGDKVRYMDPKDGQEHSEFIKEFDKLRQPKRETDKRKSLEILSPIKKADPDPYAST